MGKAVNEIIVAAIKQPENYQQTSRELIVYDE